MPSFWGRHVPFCNIWIREWFAEAQLVSENYKANFSTTVKLDDVRIDMRTNSPHRTIVPNRHIHTGYEVQAALKQAAGLRPCDRSNHDKREDRYGKIKRIHYALQRLVLTNESVEDNALQVGYIAVSGFYVAFRKNFGMTPSQYRRAYSAKAGEERKL